MVEVLWSPFIVVCEGTDELELIGEVVGCSVDLVDVDVASVVVASVAIPSVVLVVSYLGSHPAT